MTSEGKQYLELKLKSWDEKNEYWIKYTYIGYCLTLGITITIVCILSINTIYSNLTSFIALSLLVKVSYLLLVLIIGIFGIGLLYIGVVPIIFAKNKSRAFLEAYIALVSIQRTFFREYLGKVEFPFTSEEIEKLWQRHHYNLPVMKYIAHGGLLGCWIGIFYSILLLFKIVP